MDEGGQDYRSFELEESLLEGGEVYEYPPPYALPGRMGDLCGFLASKDVHPLVKAAVAQGYISAVRPFPEGNERLSRMISSAVLLRSGYDFFRDISISSVIAKENYRYYKCMQEILRSENGGDLTYFMEYYLDLLVRALDSKKERERRRVQESLAREREMAREPLRAPSAPASQVEAVFPDEEDEPLPDDSQRTANGQPSPGRFNRRIASWNRYEGSSIRRNPSTGSIPSKYSVCWIKDCSVFLSASGARYRA